MVPPYGVRRQGAAPSIPQDGDPWGRRGREACQHPVGPCYLLPPPQQAPPPCPAAGEQIATANPTACPPPSHNCIWGQPFPGDFRPKGGFNCGALITDSAPQLLPHMENYRSLSVTTSGYFHCSFLWVTFLCLYSHEMHTQEGRPSWSLAPARQLFWCISVTTAPSVPSCFSLAPKT